MNVNKLVDECRFTLKGFDTRRGNYLDHRVDYEKLVKKVAQECVDILSTYRGKMLLKDGVEYDHKHPIQVIKERFEL